MHTIDCKGLTNPQVVQKLNNVLDGVTVKVKWWGGGEFTGTKEQALAQVMGMSAGAPSHEPKKQRRSLY